MLGMGAITYGIRLSFILLWGKFTLPPALQRSLRFVPPRCSRPSSSLRSCGTAARGTCRRLTRGRWRVSSRRWLPGAQRNTMLTILVGMAALWGLQAVMGR